MVKQSNDLALEIRSHVDDIESLAAQFTHSLKITGVYGGFAISAEADDVGYDNAVNRIRLRFADVHAAQRIRLSGVDDMHRKAVIAQMGIERQPVVPRRLHAEHDGFAEAAHHVHEFVVTRLGIGKAHGLADNMPILSDYGRFVVTLGNVNTDEQHRNTSKNQVADSPLNEAGQNLLGHAKTAGKLRHPAHK